MAQTSQRAASIWQGAGPFLPGDLGQVTLVSCWNVDTLILKTVVSAVGRSYQLAAWSDPTLHSWEEQRGLPRATPLWPGACVLGRAPQSHTGLSGQTVKYFLFIRKIAFPQKKGQAKRKGARFPLFFNKMPLAVCEAALCQLQCLGAD